MTTLQSRTEALKYRLVDANLYKIQLRVDDADEGLSGYSNSENNASFRRSSRGDIYEGALYTKEAYVDYIGSNRFKVRGLYLLQDSLDGATPSRSSEARRQSGYHLSWSVSVYSKNEQFYVDYETDDYYMAVRVLHNGVYIFIEDFINLETLTLYDII